MDDWAVVLIMWLAATPPPIPCGTAFHRTIGFSRIEFGGFAILPSVLRPRHALGTLLALKQLYCQPWPEHTAFLGGLMSQ